MSVHLYGIHISPYTVKYETGREYILLNKCTTVNTGDEISSTTTKYVWLVCKK